MKKTSENEVVKEVIKKTLLVKRQEEVIGLDEIRELVGQIKKN